MPRSRVRVSKRQNWDSENMRKAVKEVIEKRMTFRNACIEFNVPKSTLERKIKQKNLDPSYDTGNKVALGPISKVFSTAEETELVSYIQLMEGRLFGLTLIDLRKIAYQLAIKNNKKNNFSQKKEIAGYDWYRCFMARHPEVSLRKP
ncbi:unnamed protein product [Macrosiphum euphorbiae]|uniref:HTH psq-type domain-containing protein n=1 Tax=Macrosiphum euphorbiae TaxID=13131 RepID=A0AAV0XJ97_9HEMI|nr:unnamed protein product [Macrosiphum euphorbiae]